MPHPLRTPPPTSEVDLICSGAVRVTERPFSDLLRHPKDVAGDVDEGDVVLRRRDEPDLWLSRADREADRSEAFAAMGRALRNLAVHSPAALTDSLVDASRGSSSFRLPTGAILSTSSPGC